MVIDMAADGLGQEGIVLRIGHRIGVGLIMEAADAITITAGDMIHVLPQSKQGGRVAQQAGHGITICTIISRE